MARKVLNRKELREENDAAERDEKTKKKSVKDEGGEEEGKKKPVKRKSRAKAAKEVRLKAFWGVFNQSMKARGAVRVQPAQTSRKEGCRTDDLRQNPALHSAGQGSH